jgi:TolB protein
MHHLWLRSAAVLLAGIAIPAGAAQPSKGHPPHSPKPPKHHPGQSSPARPDVVFVRYPGSSRHPKLAVVDAKGKVGELPLPVVATGSPALSPDGLRLAFVGGVNARGDNLVSSSADVFVAAADGSGARRVAQTAENESSPTWSPAGDQLVFVRSNAAGTLSSLWVSGPDGTGARRLTFGHLDVQPSWSPDGSQIVFVRITAHFQSSIWLVRPDGTGLHQILPDLRATSDPVWSPDGSRLLLSDQRSLFSLALDGTGRQDVVSLTSNRSAYEDPQPSWSAAGIVFCQLRSKGQRRSDIWFVQPDGSGLTRLTRSPGLDTDPALAPTG